MKFEMKLTAKIVQRMKLPHTESTYRSVIPDRKILLGVEVAHKSVAHEGTPVVWWSQVKDLRFGVLPEDKSLWGNRWQVGLQPLLLFLELLF